MNWTALAVIVAAASLLITVLAVALKRAYERGRESKQREGHGYRILTLETWRTEHESKHEREARDLGRVEGMLGEIKSGIEDIKRDGCAIARSPGGCNGRQNHE